MPERLECEVLQKARYINALTFTFTFTFTLLRQLFTRSELSKTVLHKKLERGGLTDVRRPNANNAALR